MSGLWAGGWKYEGNVIWFASSSCPTWLGTWGIWVPTPEVILWSPTVDLVRDQREPVHLLSVQLGRCGRCGGDWCVCICR